MAQDTELRHIFVSYRRQEPDKKFAYRLADDLRAVGHQVWIDVEGIHGADTWTEEIQRAIDGCYAYIVVVSPDSMASRWVRNELLYALRKKPSHVYPIMFREVDLPLELVAVHCIDFQGNYDAAFRRLLRDLPTRPRLSPHLPEHRKEESEQHEITKQARPEVKERGEEQAPGGIETKQSRVLQAAMPQKALRNSDTEVRVKIALPSSEGLRGELPDFTPSGDLIRKGDVRGSTFTCSFPVDEKTGKLKAAPLCLKVSSNDFEVGFAKTPSLICNDDQAEIALPPDSDSRTAVFRLEPKPDISSGTKRVHITLYQDSKVVAQTSVSTEVIAGFSLPEKIVWGITELVLLVSSGPALGYATAPAGSAGVPRRIEQPRREAEEERQRLETAECARQEVFERARRAREILPTPDAIPRRAAPPARRALPFWAWAVGTGLGAVICAGAVISGSVRQAIPSIEVEPTPDSTGWTPLTHSAGWEPVIQDFDGVAMALVPSGCFMMGSEDGANDEQPVHEVCFEEPFWIDVYEVSNAQFGSVGCEGTSSEDEQPRNCVDWYEAVDHCEARGTRLPTEAEWEYAARGPDGLVYPWGNEFVSDYAVWNTSQTASVGSRPGGISWVGAMDMGGNVWEWVADWYDEDYYGTLPDPAINPQGPSSGDHRVLRGGSWYNNASYLRGANRIGYDPDDANNSLGFRCARSYGD